MKRVYADMVGDLFHAGHVEFLRQARALGDELVVGVHSDDEAEWYKWRPVMSLTERAAMARACPHVDRVIEGTPVLATEAWIREHGIDLVVHGDDMDEQALALWYPAATRMGIIRTVKYTDGISSRQLRGGLGLPPETSSAVRSTRRAGDARPWRKRSSVVRRRDLTASLRRLNDVLRGTPIDGRYWVWGGALLGWAREGRLLRSDLGDVDFAYLDEDHERFLASVGALVEAGFAPADRYSGAAGRYVEHRFRRHGAKFEFFRYFPTATGTWTYSLFAGLVEYVAEVAAQPRVPFDFLGREWQKVEDHEAELGAIYGDWRTPDPCWDFTDERTIVEQRPRPPLPTEWRWPDCIAMGPGDRATPS